MNACETPIPEDPDLEVLWRAAVRDQFREGAEWTVKNYPGVAAAVITDWLVNNYMLEVLRGTVR